MTSPNYSIVFSAKLVAASSMSVGNVMIPDSTDGDSYVVATTANRGSRRSEGIALTAYGGSGTGSVQMQQCGTIDASISGLAAGSASWVRCSSTGTIERCTPVPGDDIIGFAEADGRVHLLFGAVNASGNSKVTITDAVANVETTDATVTSLYTFTIPDEAVTCVDVLCTAVKSDASAGASYKRAMTFRSNGGSVSAIGTVRDNQTDEDSSAWDFAVDNSGTTGRVRVTGASSTTIQWGAAVRIQTTVP